MCDQDTFKLDVITKVEIGLYSLVHYYMLLFISHAERKSYFALIFLMCIEVRGKLYMMTYLMNNVCCVN